MRPSRRILGSLVLAPVLAIALAANTLASTFTYNLSGFEISATSTVGTFVGVASTTDDYGTWKASIQHTVLAGGQATITGGTFAYTGTVRSIAGTFNTDGTLSQTSGATGNVPCTNQTYNVSGSVALTVPSAGTAWFAAVLTHYRTLLFGRWCIVYAATVRGTFSF